MKKLHSEERKEPHNTLNRTNNTEQELSEKWPQRRKVNNNKSNTVTKDKQLGKKRKKVALRREKGSLQHPKQNRTDNIDEKLSEKWPQEIKEKKRNTLSQRSFTKVLKKKKKSKKNQRSYEGQTALKKA